MNTTNNIHAMQISGAGKGLQNQAQGPASQDLLGFLNALVQQLQQSQPSEKSADAAQKDPQGLKVLTEKVADLLKKDGTLPESLDGTSLEDLTAKIVALLQQNMAALPPVLQDLPVEDVASKIANLLKQDDVVADVPVIKPALTRDLAAPVSSHLQSKEADDIAAKIADILGEQLQPQENTDANVEIDPALLQQIKEKIAALDPSNGEINKAVLVELKADIIQALKDKGLDQPSIENYLNGLAKSLRLDNLTTKASTEAAAETITAPAADVPETTTSPVTEEAELPAHLSQTPFNLKSKAVAVPQNAKAEAGKENAPTDIRPQLPATAAPAAKEAVQQHASPKVTANSVNPALINALANNEAGFGADGFGSQNNNASQQGFTNGLGFLKPLSADGINTQNFTNYLDTARSLPSPTTQMVNIQLQRNINAGVNMMTLQLMPADLGRLDIKLKFAKDGTVKAHMTVDKPETLAILQKDSHHLERALQQAGLDTDTDSLSFDLRQHGRQQNLDGSHDGSQHRNNFAAHVDGHANEHALQAQIAVQSYGYISASGVNIMV